MAARRAAPPHARRSRSHDGLVDLRVLRWCSDVAYRNGCTAPFQHAGRYPGFSQGGFGGEPIMLRPWTSRYSDPSTWTGACKTACSVRVYTRGSGQVSHLTTDQKVGGSS